MMAIHNPSVTVPSYPIIENIKINDHSNVSPSSNHTMKKLSNPNNIVIDGIIHHTEASQKTSFIIIIDVKPPPSTNTKDDYNDITHIRAIQAISNMLDV